MSETRDDEAFGDYLQHLRQEAGLNRQEVAYKLGLRPADEGAGKRYSASAVAKWEQNTNRPRDYDTVVRLAEALGLPKFSARRARLFWLAGKWIERAERLEGVPAARCRKLWGRTELLDEVLACLHAPDPPLRIVLLAAFGGYGKTEFARYVAAKLAGAGDFTEVAWISLKREEFQFALGAIVPVAVCEPGRAEIAALLLHRLSCRSEDELRGRLAGEPILVVLDNLETLPPGQREAVLADLHRLLGAGPSRVLATSRFDMAVPFIYRPRFAGLSLAASRDLLRDEAHHAPHPSALQSATPETLSRIWELTRGMPLALHLVVGQSQHHALSRVLDDLAAARGPGDDDEALCRYLFFQAWRELSHPARVLLAYLGAATRAPQLPGQLLGLAPAADLCFDEQTLDRALGELTRWFLLERGEDWEPGQEPAYDMHPLTRAFILSTEIRERWEQEIAEPSLREAALRQHREILRQSLGAPGQW